MDWGDVPSWVFGGVGVGLGFYYRRKLREEEARNRLPHLRMTHELRGLPTMKGYRERAGVRVHAVNDGGRAAFVKALFWGYDGQPLRDARGSVIDEAIASGKDPIKIGPDEWITLETRKLDSGRHVNELHVIDVSGQRSIHKFERVPAKGYIEAMPGEGPPPELAEVMTEPDSFAERAAF